jgi:hypothetical protein
MNVVMARKGETMPESKSLELWENTKGTSEHIDLLKERKEYLNRAFCLLAHDMLSLSLYLKGEQVVVENCKFSIRLQVSTMLGVTFHFKGNKSKPGDVDWRSLVSDIRSGNVESALKDVVGKKGFRHPRRIGGFTIDKAGELVNNDLPMECLPLIPAARLLVAEELKKQKESVADDIEYLKLICDENVEG